MKRAASMVMVLGLAAAAFHCASVTVYVSWPSPEELRQATDAIVEDVRPDAPATAPTDASDPPGGSPFLSAAASVVEPGRATVLLATWSAEPATGTNPRILPADLNLQVSTPTIRRIKESLAKRYPQLLPHYQAGRIGESNMGELVLLNTEGLSLKQKAALKKLVTAENQDRNTLYREFLKANRLDPARLPELKRQFARSWQKKAQTGWYIQTDKGQWIKKPKPKPGQAT